MRKSDSGLVSTFGILPAQLRFGPGGKLGIRTLDQRAAAWVVPLLCQSCPSSVDFRPSLFSQSVLWG